MTMQLHTSFSAFVAIFLLCWLDLGGDCYPEPTTGLSFMSTTYQSPNSLPPTSNSSQGSDNLPKISHWPIFSTMPKKLPDSSEIFEAWHNDLFADSKCPCPCHMICLVDYPKSYYLTGPVPLILICESSLKEANSLIKR